MKVDFKLILLLIVAFVVGMGYGVNAERMKQKSMPVSVVITPGPDGKSNSVICEVTK